MVSRMRLALALSISLTVGTAHAFVPDGDGALVVASGTQPRRARTIEPARITGWQATRDRDTGVVTQMWGSYVEVPGAIADAAIAERAARAFLSEHLGELAPGARSDDFVLVANRVDDGKRTVAFAQTWNGLRVVGGQLHVVFARDRLFAIGSDALPDVHAALPRARPASTTRAAAWLTTQTHVTPTLRATGERVVLPIIRGPRDIEYRVADVADATAPHQRWDVYIGPDGEPIARASRVHYAMSTLELDVGKRYASGTRIAAPAALAQITVDGAPMTTAADGTFSWPTTVAASVDATLTGSVVRVSNAAGTTATATLTAQPGQPVVWSLAGSEFDDAQLSAYVYANIAKVAGKRINPGLAWLDQPLDVNVNVNDNCNAFSTGDSIHFFRASVACENTARVADVVEHEFGHSFHQQSIIQGAGGFDFSTVEGLADFFAANIENDSGIGRGFFYTDDPVREIDPVGGEKIYPRDLSPVSHITGFIISGALWDLRKQLIDKLGTTAGIAATEKIFLGILQRAPDLTATYTAALVADDDNGDLGDGTPNSCIIESAFGRHGLAGNFRDTALATPVLDGRRISVSVDTPTGTACPPAAVTDMKLRWRVGDGAFTDIPMTAQGTVWSAELPDMPDGTVLQYQVVAALSTLETVVFPDNPADPVYQRFVGTPTEIWCEHFDADPHWKQDGAIEWEVGVSNPVNSAALDPATAFAGTTWLGTDLRGDGIYRADILTSIETPAIDATAYGRVHLQFRRWLAIEDAALDVATVRINGTQIWANVTNKSRTLDHVDKEWRFVDFDVSQAAAAGPLKISWTLASDASRQLGGWNLDEVCLVAMDGRAPRCGDGVVDDGEECDGSEHCNPNCTLRNDDGGCCSAGGGSFGSMLLGIGLIQLVMTRLRRR